MKPFHLLLFSILLTTQIKAQTTVRGYLISNKNDSVSVQIKIKKGVLGQIINQFTDKVEVDSNSILKTFIPNEIKGFGFVYEGYNYRFFSKPINKDSYKFLTPAVTGQKASFYQYANYTAGGGYAVASSKVFYTFEKADGSFLFLRNILNKNFKASLREFFNDQPDVQKLIDTKLKYWLELDKDLKEIFSFANKTNA